jgi:hypothetical protein
LRIVGGHGHFGFRAGGANRDAYYSPVFREFQQVERDYPPNGFDYDRDYEQIAERFERFRALAIAAGSIAVQT